ncbi:hypothetical protein F4801DRAFT_314165 [Xylaria longipes]|nr:hypothetical protein F4801DRAFT_314165 [Xylaria longipes]
MIINLCIRLETVAALLLLYCCTYSGRLRSHQCTRVCVAHAVESKRKKRLARDELTESGAEVACVGFLIRHSTGRGTCRLVD